MDDMWMDEWMICGVVRPADGSVLELGSRFPVWILELDLVLKPGSQNRTRLGFYLGLMRIGTSGSNWPSQVTAQHPGINHLLT
jgi:hypothetical protein